MNTIDLNKGLDRFEYLKDIQEKICLSFGKEKDFLEQFNMGQGYPKVEIKNLNSFKAVKQSLRYEELRQQFLCSSMSIVPFKDLASEQEVWEALNNLKDVFHLGNPDLYFLYRMSLGGVISYLFLAT